MLLRVPLLCCLPPLPAAAALLVRRPVRGLRLGCQGDVERRVASVRLFTG